MQTRWAALSVQLLVVHPCKESNVLQLVSVLPENERSYEMGLSTVADLQVIVNVDSCEEVIFVIIIWSWWYSCICPQGKTIIKETDGLYYKHTCQRAPLLTSSTYIGNWQANSDDERLLTWWRHQMKYFRYWPFLVTGGFTKDSDAELWCFLWSAPDKQTVEQTIETPMIWDAITLIMTSL